MLPSYFTKTTAPRRRTSRASLFMLRRSTRAAAADEEPRSPQVNCAGQVLESAGGGSPDYACFFNPATAATSTTVPFKWRRLFPFLRDRRRQVSEEPTTTRAAAAMVVGDERARYLVRPPGKASTSSPPANALVLMRCRSVDPNSKLPRAKDSRRVWEGSRVVLDKKETTSTSQVQDVCGNQDGPGRCSTLCMGSEEEFDEEEVPAREKNVEELNG